MVEFNLKGIQGPLLVVVVVVDWGWVIN